MTSGPKRRSAVPIAVKTPKVRSPSLSSEGGALPIPAWGEGGGEGTAGAEFLGEELLPVVAGHVGVAPGLLAEPVEELAEGVVVGVGVLADVHRREVHAERRQRAHRAVERAARDQLAAIGE